MSRKIILKSVTVVQMELLASEYHFKDGFEEWLWLALNEVHHLCSIMLLAPKKYQKKENIKVIKQSIKKIDLLESVKSLQDLISNLPKMIQLNISDISTLNHLSLEKTESLITLKKSVTTALKIVLQNIESGIYLHHRPREELKKEIVEKIVDIYALGTGLKITTTGKEKLDGTPNKTNSMMFCGKVLQYLGLKNTIYTDDIIRNIIKKHK